MTSSNQSATRPPVCLPIPEAMVLWPHELGDDSHWETMTRRQQRLYGVAVGVALATLGATMAIAVLGGA